MASSLGHALSVTHTNFKNRGENRLTSILYTKQKQKPFCTALIRPRVVNIRLFYFGAFRQFILVKYNTLLWWKQFDFFSVCFCFVSHKISMLKFGLPARGKRFETPWVITWSGLLWANDTYWSFIPVQGRFVIWRKSGSVCYS